MKKHRKTKHHPENGPQESIHPWLDEDANPDPENLYNLGPTGHGPDICFSDADPGL